MADKEQLEILKLGSMVWNEWRSKNPNVKPDLTEVRLNGMDLRGTNLIQTNLSGADIRKATLSRVNLSGATLTQADLREANLIDVCINNAMD